LAAKTMNVSVVMPKIAGMESTGEDDVGGRHSGHHGQQRRGVRLPFSLTK
jgi:hypothetical protein